MDKVMMDAYDALVRQRWPDATGPIEEPIGGRPALLWRLPDGRDVRTDGEVWSISALGLSLAEAIERAGGAA